MPGDRKRGRKREEDRDMEGRKGSERVTDRDTQRVEKARKKKKGEWGGSLCAWSVRHVM